MRKFALITLAVLSLPLQAATVNIKPLNGLNGNAPTSAPTCVPADASIPGIYGQEWCFGTTYLGGTINTGTIYRIKPDGSKHTVIHSFDVMHGLTPSQQPAISKDRQHLYGTTSQGGLYGSGIIYDFNLQSGEISILASFSGPVGSTPQAPPIIVGNALYGVTGQSGASGYGTVWTIPLSGGEITVLHSFAGGSGDVATPFGALTYNPLDKRLYGMSFTAAAHNGGGIFSVALDGSNYQLRASFDQSTGYAPQMGALLLASDGMLYGNAWSGGTDNAGTIFRFNPLNNALGAIFNYTNSTGTHPYNQLAESPSGNWLYSVSWLEGSKGAGAVLAVKRDGSSYVTLLTLNEKTTGGKSQSGAAIDSSGKNILIGVSGGSPKHIGSILSIRIPDKYR